MKYNTFENWMEAVNDAVAVICGMSSDDLPDVCYRDWFEDGISPTSAARRAMRNCME